MQIPFALEPLESRAYLSGGQTDPSFGASGIVTLDRGARINQIFTLSNTDTIAIGTLNSAAYVKRISQFGSVRGAYNANVAAAMSAEFSTAPSPIVDFLHGPTVFAVDTSDRLLAAADIALHKQPAVRVIRLTTKGMLDTSFGVGGKVDLGLTNVSALTALSNGKIFVGGVSTIDDDRPDDFTDYHLGLVQLTDAGDVNTHFGTHDIASVGDFTRSLGDLTFVEFPNNQFFLEPDGQVVYLRDITTGFLPDEGSPTIGMTQSGFVVNPNGTTSELSNSVFSNDAPILPGATENADGSIQIRYFVFDSHQPSRTPFDLDSATLSLDGTISNVVRLQSALPTPPLFTNLGLTQSDGKFLTNLSNQTLGRFMPAGGNDPLWTVTGNGLTGVQLSAIGLASDGEILAAYARKPDSAARPILVELQRTEAPIARFAGATLTTSKKAYDLTIDWYDPDDAINPLGNGNLEVLSPDGTSRLVTLDSSQDIPLAVSGDHVVAHYRLKAPNKLWSLADNGRYTVRVRADQVSDASNHFADARTIGSFVVHFTKA